MEGEPDRPRLHGGDAPRHLPRPAEPMRVRGVLVVLGAALLSPACSGLDDVEQGAPDTAPHDDGVGHWSLAPVQTCASPVALGYTDASSRLGVEDLPPPPDTQKHLAVEGGIGLLETSTGPLLVYTRPDGTAAGVHLDTGASFELPVEQAFSFSQGDLDGDGVTDLVVSGAPPQVFWDLGATGDVGDVSPLPASEGNHSVRDVTVADLDGDGLEDAFLTYATFSDDLTLERGELALGQGDRTFASGALPDVPDDFWGRAFDTVANDFDGDGTLDLYLCNDHGVGGGPNGVLLSDGRGGLRPADDARGADVAVNCMGATWGDFDADGRLDLYLGETDRHYLLEDTDLGFVDVAQARGLAPMDGPQMSWGVAVADLDNDGLPDLVAGSSDFWLPGVPSFPLLVHRQQADGSFAEVGAALGLPTSAGTRSVVPYDVNGDGVLDLYVGDAFRSPWLFLSDGCTAGSWLEVAAPSGTQVRVRAGDRVWGALATTDASYASTGPAVAHVGLGDVDAVDEIELAVPGVGEVVLEGPIEARRRVVWTP